MNTTQREIQNLRLREIKAKRKADGLCVTCADKSRPGKVQCQECSDAGKARYREATGRPPLPKKITRKSGAKLIKGVVRSEQPDGYGRMSAWYVASLTIKRKTQQRKWSVDKHGEDGARLAASLQRMLWLIEAGQWNPAAGDPLAIASYAESFAGNRDYDDCEISDVSSPWTHEYEDVA